MKPRVVAYALDLFGGPPKPMLAWRPAMYQWVWAGCPIPPDAAAVRQWRMLTAETRGET